MLNGGFIKATTISEQYTYEDFTKANPNHIVLFLSSEEKGLRPAEEDLKKVNPGISIYALIVPESSTSQAICPDLNKG